MHRKYLLILLSFLILETCYAITLPPLIDFSGSWCWDKNSKYSTFSITINKFLNKYRGGYASVASSGNKIDDNDDAFSFEKPLKNIVKTTIRTGISGDTGVIQLKLVNRNTIEWRILKAPEQEFYAPEIALLHKCKG
ncbi:hypothetical protein [Legionella shakespearei]|uniref:Uncharacterized protein n=1 Tax=Legionella shakespearei DSM 23087 TaxID=1122169 RepID=A0A0W0Z1W2_9GAMM|nr:hypothetical protein [Legionella shakespearei]KTD63152.1 hypothetical protein Lsha_0783 [Legionella shakespearei DSM 23087]